MQVGNNGMKVMNRMQELGTWEWYYLDTVIREDKLEKIIFLWGIDEEEDPGAEV